jgi:hypothetical protein
MSSLCVYPFSPSYATLPRLNTLLLLLAVLYGPADNWATKGALAALMTRTAGLALHTFALLGVLEWELARPVEIRSFDLDILGAWALLSVVATSIPMMLSWAPSLLTSKARPLIRIWGVLVAAGALCAYAGVHKIATVVNEGDTCENAMHLPMREYVVPVRLPLNDLYMAPPKQQVVRAWDIAALVAVAFGIWTCVRIGRAGIIKSKSSRNWYGVVGSHQVQDLQFNALTCTPAIVGLEKLVLFAVPVVFYGLVILHELWLWTATVPVLEGLDAFEQWSCWVMTGLVVIATVINWLVSRRSAPKPAAWHDQFEGFGGGLDVGYGPRSVGVIGNPAIIR